MICVHSADPFLDPTQPVYTIPTHSIDSCLKCESGWVNTTIVCDSTVPQNKYETNMTKYEISPMN